MSFWNPQIEALPWAEQAAMDEAAYRGQVAYLFANSRFYREKLVAAGFKDATDVGGFDRIADLPMTEKDELRQSRTQDDPIGTHLAAPMRDITRIYSTSGTTGTPSYIPLTAEDLADWVEISCRSYGASGVSPQERIVTTYNAGPFVAGATLDAFARLDLCHIPVGTGNSDRVLTAVQALKPSVLGCTPSFAQYLAEKAGELGVDLANSSVERILVAGEPGGGEAAMRARLERAWGAKVTEVMGIGDISVSLWGECECQDGMHFSGRGFVHFELVEPDGGSPVPMEDGAEGELVYTHLRHRAAPLLRFRSRDHVRVSTTRCACGRTAPRVRCIGRTDDMLIVRGVNVFPTALRQIVGEFEPLVSGVIQVQPLARGTKQAPPLKLSVELADEAGAPEGLADSIRQRIRDRLLVTTDVSLVSHGSLARTDYKSKLVDWSQAT